MIGDRKLETRVGLKAMVCLRTPWSWVSLVVMRVSGRKRFRVRKVVTVSRVGQGSGSALTETAASTGVFPWVEAGGWRFGGISAASTGVFPRVEAGGWQFGGKPQLRLAFFRGLKPGDGGLEGNRSFDWRFSAG